MVTLALLGLTPLKCLSPAGLTVDVDANALYAWAMSKPLPIRGFRWMNEEELRDWKMFQDAFWKLI